jgi:Ca2+-binding EF-hand superfamily protein
MQYYDKYPDARPQLDESRKQRQKSEVQLTPKEQAQIEEIFDLFDTDGGKTIDAKELNAAMLALGFQSHNKASRFGTRMSFSSGSKRNSGDLNMDHVDLDGSNAITIDEFTSLMKGEFIGHGALEEIWTAFSVLNRNHSALTPGWTATDTDGEDWGRVSLDGLRRACREFDVRLAEPELKMMMDEVDTDRDGSIDREEFMRIMNQAPWF